MPPHMIYPSTPAHRLAHSLVVSRGRPRSLAVGMSRDLDENTYYKSGDANARLPIRWCSPEAALDGKFGESSDVW